MPLPLSQTGQSGVCVPGLRMNQGIRFILHVVPLQIGISR